MRLAGAAVEGPGKLYCPAAGDGICDAACDACLGVVKAAPAGLLWELLVLTWCRGCLDTVGLAQVLAAAALPVLLLPVMLCRGCLPAVGCAQELAAELLLCAAGTLVAPAVLDAPHLCAAVWNPVGCAGWLVPVLLGCACC